jgi:adenosylhomocysteine nucleosidase
VIAILSAMHEELHALAAGLERDMTTVVGGREFHRGRLHGHEVLLVLSGIGKVAASITATLACQHFGARRIVFTGVAGGLADGVAIGDVVIGRELLQHDLDASPIFPRFEVPLTGRSRFGADATLSDAVAAAARRCIAVRAGAAAQARLHEGLVVSGDRFVSTQAESRALRGLLPDALAVEMEGAAVAQVCEAFGVPFAVLRTISDRADDAAAHDFGRFVADVAAVYTREIVGDWLAHC